MLHVLHWLRQCSKIAAGKPAANMLLGSILLSTAGLRPAKHNESKLFGVPPNDVIAGRMLQSLRTEKIMHFLLGPKLCLVS